MNEEPPKYPCQIEELKLSCYGCCGPEVESGTRKYIDLDLSINTEEFNNIIKGEPTEKKLKQFRDRFENWEFGKSGLCMNLVRFDENCFACPLHNKINEIVPKEIYEGPKEDLREKHCDVNYECETFIYYNLMSKEQKELFVKWVKDKKYDYYTYSKENITGKLIKEFYNSNY